MSSSAGPPMRLRPNAASNTQEAEQMKGKATADVQAAKRLREISLGLTGLAGEAQAANG